MQAAWDGRKIKLDSELPKPEIQKKERLTWADPKPALTSYDSEVGMQLPKVIGSRANHIAYQLCWHLYYNTFWTSVPSV